MPYDATPWRDPNYEFDWRRDIIIAVLSGIITGIVIAYLVKKWKAI